MLHKLDFHLSDAKKENIIKMTRQIQFESIRLPITKRQKGEMK